ncbi:MAG TPA: alpha/beta fold hydrolase [Candidatus Angelobacter sp.]
MLKASVIALLSLTFAVSCAAQAQEKLFGFTAASFKDSSGHVLPYRLFIPPAYDAQTKYPLILWLHGGAGRGNDNQRQISENNRFGSQLWTSDDLQAQRPSFVLAPQCPENYLWTSGRSGEPGRYLEAAMDLLNQIVKQYAIDRDRIYVAGQSMGGMGALALVAAHPHTFAAAVTVSADIPAAKAAWLAPTALWVFVGEKDELISIANIRELAHAVHLAGGNIRLTQYPGAGHDIWERAFAEPQLPAWLLARKRDASR